MPEASHKVLSPVLHADVPLMSIICLMQVLADNSDRPFHHRDTSSSVQQSQNPLSSQIDHALEAATAQAGFR